MRAIIMIAVAVMACGVSAQQVCDKGLASSAAIFHACPDLDSGIFTGDCAGRMGARCSDTDLVNEAAVRDCLAQKFAGVQQCPAATDLVALAKPCTDMQIKVTERCVLSEKRCLTIGNPCESFNECCPGLGCGPMPQLFSDGTVKLPYPRQCCTRTNDPCNVDADCCNGNGASSSGVCQLTTASPNVTVCTCIGQGAFCATQNNCCQGLTCVADNPDSGSCPSCGKCQ